MINYVMRIFNNVLVLVKKKNEQKKNYHVILAFLTVTPFEAV